MGRLNLGKREGKAGKRAQKEKGLCFMPLKSDSQWMLWAVPNSAPSLLCSPSSGLRHLLRHVLPGAVQEPPQQHHERPQHHGAGAAGRAVPVPGGLPSSSPSTWLRQDAALTPVPPSQVRVMSPYQGPPSDYVVVKMIPDNRLPPRHLHSVHTGKTFAVIKWESPYDSPDQDMVTPHRAFSCPRARKILAQRQSLAFLLLEKA